jgi:hypothetical protein
MRRFATLMSAHIIATILFGALGLSNARTSKDLTRLAPVPDAWLKVQYLFAELLGYFDMLVGILLIFLLAVLHQH